MSVSLGARSFFRHLVYHAKAFYAAAELGILPKSHFALFKTLHIEGEKVYTEEAVVNFLQTSV